MAIVTKTQTFTPVDAKYTSNASNFQLLNPNNAFTDSTSNTYATALPSRKQASSTQLNLYWDFSAIPSDAVVKKAVTNLKVRTTTKVTNCMWWSWIGGSYQSSSYDLNFASSTAKVFTYSVSYAGIAGSRLTDPSVNNRIELQFTNSKNNSGDLVYIYGADVTITWTEEVPDPSPSTFYIKSNGAWSPIALKKAYKKIDGVWVEQSQLNTLFYANINYVKGN